MPNGEPACQIAWLNGSLGCMIDVAITSIPNETEPQNTDPSASIRFFDGSVETLSLSQANRQHPARAGYPRAHSQTTYAVPLTSMLIGTINPASIKSPTMSAIPNRRNGSCR